RRDHRGISRRSHQPRKRTSAARRRRRLAVGMLHDLYSSWIEGSSLDAAQSSAGHALTLSKMAFLHFFARGKRQRCRRRVGSSGIELPNFMFDIIKDRDRPVGILPIGDVDSRTLAEISGIIRDVFGSDIRLLRSREPRPDMFYNEDKDLDGNILLDELYTPTFFPRFDRVIAITDYPLIGTSEERKDIPVHGYASLDWPVGIISTGLLGSTDLYENMLKVVIHEIGHTFGIPHCPEERCVMKKVDS